MLDCYLRKWIPDPNGRSSCLLPCMLTSMYCLPHVCFSTWASAFCLFPALLCIPKSGLATATTAVHE